MIPDRETTSSPENESFTTRMTGMAPQTAASNPSSSRDSLAAAKRASPFSARRALFAVTRCLPLLSARSQTPSTKGDVPPMVSTTRSISGSANSESISEDASAPEISLPPPAKRESGSRCRSAAAPGNRSTILTSSTRRPALLSIAAPRSRRMRATPPPTVPHPRRAILKGFRVVSMVRSL
jgi:hypothetical protein